MTGWRHSAETLGVRWCLGPGPNIGYCGCQNPTPDPASPCGYVGCAALIPEGMLGSRDDVSVHVCTDEEMHAESGDTSKCHPHQPTRCTCGHAIEAVR